MPRARRAPRGGPARSRASSASFPSIPRAAAPGPPSRDALGRPPRAPAVRRIARVLRTTVERDISQADAVRRMRWTMTAQTKGTSGLGRAGRMSRQRKRDAVLRLLRGEDLEMVSRSLGVTAATLTAWRDAFLAGGEA